MNIIYQQDRKMAQEILEQSNLTDKQQEVLSHMIAGKNVFVTGPSGTGKTHIIKLFKQLYGRQKTIAMTSTTGISALLFGGTTLHSYLGIGLGTGSVDSMTAHILKKTYLKERWNRLDTLVIDEISMLSPELFDKLEAVACNVRRGRNKRMLNKETEKAFGGIQLILSGDFLQLPVVKSDDFCFEAKTWDKCIDEMVHLTDIIRQKDIEFQTVLNELRFGIVSKKGKKILKSRIGAKLENELGIKPTCLLTTNASVDQINEKELDKLVTEETQFYQYDMDIYMYEFVKNKSYVIDKYRKNCIAPDTLQLCEGAQVMLVCNLDIDSGLVNGSRGVVIKFVEERPVVRFLNGLERIIDYHVWEVEQDDKKLMQIKQIPLKVAYAITVHKGQGNTLDYAEVDLGNIFTFGQAYVALSRVKSLEGLSIIDIDFNSIQAHPKAIEFYKKIDNKL